MSKPVTDIRSNVKPASTAWCDTAQALQKGVIVLDLRRMNRILEIDEKNMFAVVEPYVIGAQLQAEVMKCRPQLPPHRSWCWVFSLGLGHGFDRERSR